MSSGVLPKPRLAIAKKHAAGQPLNRASRGEQKPGLIALIDGRGGIFQLACTCEQVSLIYDIQCHVCLWSASAEIAAQIRVLFGRRQRRLATLPPFRCSTGHHTGALAKSLNEQCYAAWLQVYAALRTLREELHSPTTNGLSSVNFFCEHKRHRSDLMCVLRRHFLIEAV